MKKNRVKAISAIAPILTPRVVYTICDPYRMVALLGYTIISVFKRCLIWRGASTHTRIREHPLSYTNITLRV